MSTEHYIYLSNFQEICKYKLHKIDEQSRTTIITILSKIIFLNDEKINLATL